MPDAGSVHVDVLPDLKGFGPSLRSQLKAVAAKEGVTIPVEANTKPALARLVGLEKAASRLDGRTIRLNVRTNQSGPMRSGGAAGGGGGGGGGGQRPFTGMSPAAGAGVAIGGPALVPAVGALTGALGGLTSGFGAATAASAGFATAAVPAIMDVAEVLELQEAAAEGGAEATKQYQKALNALTPAARNTVDAWGSLTDSFDEWQRSLQGDTLPVVTRGIELLEKELPSLTPIVRESAAGFDGLLSSAQAALDAPYWERFTGFVERQAQPSIGILGRSVGNLAMGFTGLLVSFEPLWNTMGPGMEDLTRRFAAWGNESENFTGFIDWVTQNGPTFADAFVSIADAAIDVGVALAPLGTIYAKGLGQLAEAISWVADTAPWLIQVAAAAGTARVAFGLFSRVNSGLIQPLREMPGRLRELSSSMSSVDAPTTTATTATRGFRGALSGAVGVLGGPWGLAIGAGITAIGLFADGKADAAAKTRAYTEALKADSGAIGENTRQVAVNYLEQEGLLELADELGFSMNRVTDAALGQGNAMKSVNGDIRSQIEHYKELRDAGEINAQTYQAAVDPLNQLRNGIAGENTELRENVEQHEREQEALGNSTTKQGEFNTTVGQGATQVRDLRTALDELSGANIRTQETEIRLEEAIDSATQAAKDNGETLDTNTEKGRANKRELNNLKDATFDHLDSMEQNDAGAQAMRNEHERARKKFIQVAKQMGLTKDEAKQLANEYLGMPDDVNTAIGVTAKGSWSLQDMNSPGDPFSRYGTSGRAEGGPIHGPGTPTSDSIPAWLSTGEYVQRASAVDYYGTGLMTALNERRIPKEALGFATGGWVTSGQGDTPWDRVDDHRVDTRDAYGRMLRQLINSLGEEAADQFEQYASGPMGVVRLANESIGDFPESGGNNTNAITSWFGMNGAPWCAMFISWLFAQTGASKALGSASRTAWTGDYYTSGMPRVSNPQPGDVAVYGRDHVNLVSTPGGGRRVGGNQSNNVTAAPYSGGAIFRPMWGRAYAQGGLVDVLDQDRREDGKHPLLDYPQLTGLAAGGTASGWTVVGEQGPELARFDNSAQVYSTQESARLLAEAARAGGSAQGGDGASSPLIGSYHQHLHDSQATLREAMGELTHTLRVTRKGGVHTGG